MQERTAMRIFAVSEFPDQRSGNDHRLVLCSQRKRRRKRTPRKLAESPCIFKILGTKVECRSLPKMIAFPLILMPLLIALFPSNVRVIVANSQLVLDHPRFRVRNASSNASKLSPLNPISVPPPLFHSSYNLNPTANQEIKRVRPPNGEEEKSIDRPNEEKHHDLLRKLSSTMLLESLLRHPFPINKSAFPPLTIPKISHPGVAKGSSISQNRVRPSGQKPKDSTFKMNTSTTNHNAVTDHVSAAPEQKFNSSSLNYLVDKLLKMKPYRGEATPRQRPRVRQRLSNDYHEVNSLHNPQAFDLDTLIKNEYDSRVEPMIKSLKAQQDLSIVQKKNSSSATTKSWPQNHRGDEIGAESGTTTTLSSINDFQIPQNTTPNLFANIPTTTQAPHLYGSTTQEAETNISRVIFEGLELGDIGDSDDDEEDDDDEIKDIVGDSAPSHESNSSFTTGKILRNVPPYLIGDSSSSNQRRKNGSAESDVSHSETQATTSSSKESSDFDSGMDARKNEPLKIDKSTGASVRGSLVFSDGADEAERANSFKRSQFKKNQGDVYGHRLGSSTPRPKIRISTPSPASRTKSDKLGDSFLLNQLFSTVNPLTLTYKLNERLNNREQPEMSFPNPLIYKGYVGKDDHLLSVTAGDWSRPMGVRDNREPVQVYKTFPGGLHTITTPSPPTVPHDYFLHQPVTNAQSVPSMVIPTSDPHLEITTRPPNVRFDQFDRARQTFQRPPSSVRLEHANESRHNQTVTLFPINPATRFDNKDRKYSYQLPAKDDGRYQAPQNVTLIGVNDGAPRPFGLGESDPGRKVQNDTAPEQIKGNPRNSSWSPTKIAQDENSHTIRNVSLPLDQFQNFTGLLFVTGNSSSPMIVPIVKSSPKGIDVKPSIASDNKAPGGSNESVYGLELSVSPQTTTQSPTARPSSNPLGIEESGSSRNELTRSKTTLEDNQRGKSKFNNSRVRLKNTSTTMGTETEPDDSQGDRRLKDSNSGSDLDVIKSDIDEAQEPSDGETNWQQRFQSKKKSESNEHVRGSSSQTKPSKGFINHEPAGSEIFLTETDKTSRLLGDRGVPKRNQTARLNISQQNHSNTESIMIGGSDGGSIHLATNADPHGPTSFGSTIIPNPNYYGEVSSESPLLDGNLPILGAGSAGRTTQRLPTSDDPYQRISSNNILTTIQQPLPTTQIPATTRIFSTPPSKPTLRDDPAGTKTPGKSSNDRLAFILIGGSCVLSVVCLVLAAMSMRCQDMCDDYRSLRNAERAALKLQRHRLKYTRSHQKNRLDHGQRTLSSHAERGMMIDELENGGSLDSGTDHVAKHTNKPVQFGNNLHAPITNDNLDLNNVCLNPVNHRIPTLIHKSNQPCTCANCLNQRWFYRDEVMASNSKHLSWMHPYYYMQHHGRLRPLFGVASSVGTFFPRRMGDQSQRGGGSVDAQILIDSQPQHICSTSENPRVTRSKSILNRKNSHHHRAHANAAREGTIEVHPHLRCNNPDHNHHVCQDHHKCTFESSGGEEGELNVGESVRCVNLKCPINHLNQNLNNKFRLLQSRNNGLNRNKTEAWRIDSTHRPPFNHHNVDQHCHNHPTSSSDSSSIAQCTCSKDQKPLLGMNNARESYRVSHHKQSRHGLESGSKQQTKRDKSMLVWSTNRDRLI